MTLQCGAGRVTWRSPYGGLRLVFPPPVRSHHFEVCFKATALLATAKFSSEKGDNELNFLAVLESSPSRRVTSLDDEVCLRSSRHRAVTVYIEAERVGASPALGRVTIDYDVDRVVDHIDSDIDDNMDGERNH